MEITVAESGPKVFNDPIHGSIVIPELCVKIIDTPEFQRLRSIKQLGGVSYVYPGAVHSRFEHSIGVCYLAGQLVKSLKEHQPELNISEEDVMCIQIAGLCHDLGHGPFSHMFENKVIPRLFKGKSSNIVKYTHEDYSERLFDHLLETNKLIQCFGDKGLTVHHLKSIKYLFKGRKPITDEDGVFQGKGFLYEIVANNRSGIDVDKWDYFARDCHMLGFSNNFDHKRCIQMARVLEIEGEQQICFRDKEANNLYDMFYTRLTLHRRAYQHKVARIVECMITDIMVKALDTDAVKFKGKDDKPLSLREAIEGNDLEAYCQMTDDIINQIRQSTDTSVLEAQQILKRIDTRDLYVLAGEKRLKGNKSIIKSNMDVDAIVLEIERYVVVPDMPKGTIIIDYVNFDYGRKDKNPIDALWFYDKDLTPVRVKKDKVSHLLPDIFREQLIRVFCKEKKFKKYVSDAFDKWCTCTFGVEN